MPPAGPSELTFLFGQFVPRCRHVIDKRFEGYCVLQYMHGGAVSLTIDGQKTVMEGRWWWSSYPGPRIAFKPLSPGGSWVHRYLAFKGPAVEAWTREGLFPVPPMPAPSASPARPESDWPARFDALLDLSRREDPLGRRRAGLELERILCELAELRAVRTDEPAWLAHAKARFESLEEVPPAYADIAAGAGMSERTFRREFARLTGLPPHQYLLASRIGHAREMLAHTDLPLKQIARDLGYADVFYFSRQFRKQTGVPPGVYRKSREG